IVWGIGCSVPIAGGLDERDANLVADALNRSGIDATKGIDPGSEGRYQVLVAKSETAEAIATLRDHDLPPRHAPGVIDSIGKGSLVPSPLAEHAQYVAGISGDLERSLASIDGILGARVHLSVPSTDALSVQSPHKPSASVLLRYRGETPPVGDDHVRSLIAGAVAGLAPEAVTVVSVSRPDAPALPARELTQIGPVSVTRATSIWLRVMIGSSVFMMLTLTAALLFFWARARKLMLAVDSVGEHA
ncbi:MAG: hypothetical protein FWD57_10185, partial [Polyangiaceae bacterium]|nr:hypothetical protein [Polyangiaceae bacterium]